MRPGDIMIALACSPSTLRLLAMKLSAKTQYACLAMLQLAEDASLGAPTPLRSLSERQDIPEGFLVQILQSLRRAGLVTSTRGSCGGYRLSRPAEGIALAEVITAIEGHEPPPAGASASPFASVLHSLCKGLQQAKWQRLESLSLADLLDQASAPVAPMWYI